MLLPITFLFSFFFMLPPSPIYAAPEHELEEINTFSYTCYQLECLWHALYGDTNPLLPYIETYKTAIKEYAARRSIVTPRAVHDSATELVTAQLQDHLKQVQQHAKELLDQYELIPLKGSHDESVLTLATPSAYAATPLREQPPATQDGALQQVLSALQQLQTQQQSTQTESHPGTLKEQLILFTIGILFLGTATYLIKKRISKNITALKAETNAMLVEIEAPHAQAAPCGMRAQLECAINQFNKRGGTA